MKITGKHLLAWMILLVAATSSYAQDYIYLTRDRGRIAAQHIHKHDSEVRYQPFGEDNSPFFTLDEDEVSYIAYQDGTRSQSADEEVVAPRKFYPNVISFHLFDLIVNEFTVSYEYIFPSGKMGLQVPLSVGFSETNSNGFDDVSNQWTAGLNLNLYPTGQGKVRYMLGPAIEVGNADYNDWVYNNGYSYEESGTTFVTRFYINNALVVKPTPAMSFSVVGGIGIRYLANPGEANEQVRSVGAFSFNLSYRF